MYKKNIILLIIMLIFTGCLSSNEDPTNIELEVLRASLLEKQLTIDELRSTIDEYVLTTSEHLSEIERLNKTLESEISIRKRIASESNKLLRINTDEQHYYEIDQEYIFMINKYEDTQNEYALEKLYLYRNGSLPILIYSSEDIEFDLLREQELVIIASNETIIFQDYIGEIVYDFPLKEHGPEGTVDLFNDTYIDIDRPDQSVSIIVRTIEENKEKLLGLYTVNYSDLDDIIVTFHELTSFDYYIDEIGEIVYYSVLDGEDKNILYRYNLSTGEQIQLAVNTNLPFKLYKKDNQVYYYSELVESEKSITLAE